MASSVSAYEQQRRENVLRNRDRLTELGVNGPIGRSAGGEAASTTGKRRNKRNAATQELPTRKSARLKNLPAISYELPEDEVDTEMEARVRKARAKEKKGMRKPNKASNKTKTTNASASPQRLGVLSTSPHSCKNLSIGPEEWSIDRVGCKLWPSHGLGPKAYVMAQLRGKNSTSPPKFSKYSGIQEWENAVCLFVNISSKNGQVYKNLFLDDYKRMTWFAQKHAHEETPVVIRLVELTTRAAMSGSTGRDPVLLFCRREGEPYIFCGRVELSEYYQDHRPIKFIWTLVDRDQLMTSLDFFNILNSVN
jgi:hypothetical protein